MNILIYAMYKKSSIISISLHNYRDFLFFPCFRKKPAEVDVYFPVVLENTVLFSVQVAEENG